MGAAGQQPQHPSRVVVVLGLGQHLAVDVDRGVGGEHDHVTGGTEPELAHHRHRLVPGDTLDVLDGVLGSPT